jgi:RNA polymerase-interacting CarD/CdnL/TRCF family regulator
MGEGLTQPCPKLVRDQQELTEEQEAYVREFARKRLAAMLSTVPIDEQEGEAHLRAVYRVARVAPPGTIRWFDSPLSFLQACEQGTYWPGDVVTQMWDSLWESGNPRVWSHVEERLPHMIQDRVLSSVPKRIRDRVNAILQDSIGAIEREDAESMVNAMLQAYAGESIWVRARVGVRTIVRDSVWDSMRDSVQDGHKAWASAGQSANAYRKVSLLASYRFFHEMFEENQVIHLARFNEMVSGYLLGEREAWLVRKPTVLELDAQGRLHSVSGPCLEYRDLWGIYAWHGVRVFGELILYPEQVTRETWVQEPNVEVRRAIQERLGYERFIEMMGGRQIDANRRGKLMEIDLGSDFRERVAHYVQVQDSSTERQYYLRVPPSITSADEAIAWTFGLDARDYQPGQET